MKWITATGYRIKISKMGLSHIHRCIKMIDNGGIKDSYRLSVYPSLKQELIRRYYEAATDR